MFLIYGTVEGTLLSFDLNENESIVRYWKQAEERVFLMERPDLLHHGHITVASNSEC